MKEPVNPTELKVNDRRRFDANGNPRPDAPERADVPLGAGANLEPSAAPATGPELDAARRRIDELARAYQGLVQEREDYKQRLSRERDRLIEVEKANVAQVMLDVVDELDLCLQASSDPSPLAKGVRLIRDGILAKLQGSGIERIDVLGRPFDPNTAEASDMEVTPEQGEDQRVTAELRAGYRFKDRVIRPARVRVAKYVAPASA